MTETTSGTTSTKPAEQHTFQAEVRQLLDIVIHALYSDKEIFVRELVSNASDAIEKLRLKQLTENDLEGSELPLEIRISADETAKTITIEDSGIGMTSSEVIEYLGTIAHSGTKSFLEKLKHAGKQASDVIGQFGVGFYSAFMVAKKVEVFTKSCTLGTHGVHWISDGREGYSVEAMPGLTRGTKVVIHLNTEHEEFAQIEKIRGILRRYSNFVSSPLFLNGEKTNTIEALWLKSKSDISAEQYEEFFKFIAHTDQKPISHLHFSADAPIELNALLFVPHENIERFGFGRSEPGVALHCRRVLIDAKPEGLLPEWLRFLRGVIDSSDLPLNISREMLQDNFLVKKIGEIMTKRFLKHLEQLAKNETETYTEFYSRFSRFLKEGIVTSFEHAQALGGLLRFESSMTEAGKTTSLSEYVERMKDEQEGIYYLIGTSRAQLENSPYYEAFKARGLEVILWTDPSDAFVMEALRKFAEKDLLSGDRADLKLTDLQQDGVALEAREAEKFTTWANEILGDSIEKIELSDRLVNRAAAALQSPNAASLQTRQFMAAMGQDMPETKARLALNPRHDLIKRLSLLRDSNPDLAALLLGQLADTALLEAGMLENPQQLSERFYKLLDQVTR